jgi:hypothetical protein
LAIYANGLQDASKHQANDGHPPKQTDRQFKQLKHRNLA